MVESLLFLGAGDGEKILGAGAGQKWTGSATLSVTLEKELGNSS